MFFVYLENIEKIFPFIVVGIWVISIIFSIFKKITNPNSEKNELSHQEENLFSKKTSSSKESNYSTTNRYDQIQKESQEAEIIDANEIFPLGNEELFSDKKELFSFLTEDKQIETNPYKNSPPKNINNCLQKPKPGVTNKKSENKTYAVPKAKKTIEVEDLDDLISSRKTLQQAFLIHEILDKPKSLQEQTIYQY